VPITNEAKVDVAASPDRGGWPRWVPAIAAVRDYRRAWFAKDLGAGLVLTAMLVPIGMGYAQAAGLPAIHGLYATIVPLLVYALLGPSRILVLGPDSALAGLIAATILPMAAGDSERAVALAGALAILSGAFCLIAGLSGAGIVADLFSKPIRYGFLNGIALTVLVAQLPKLLGMEAPGGSLWETAQGTARGVVEGRINGAAFAIGAGCLVVMVLGKRFARRVPWVLIAVVGATAVTAAWSLAERGGVAVVGAMPRGLPSFVLPGVDRADWWALVSGAFAVALVAFTDTTVLSRSLAVRSGRDVNTSQELVALGAANLLTGLFRGFPISASSSRTPLAESAGAQTQLACVIGATCLAALLFVAPSLTAHLPVAALAAVVIVACLGLIEVEGVIRLFRLRRGEFVLSLICLVGVATGGTVRGILLAVALALLAFVWRAWRPYSATLGRVDGLKGYHDLSRYPEARRIPGLVLFRWDAPLFFANAEIFRATLRRAIAEAPTPTRWVVVAAEPVTDVDTTAADMLATLDQELQVRGIELAFAEMKDPVKDHLHRYGLFLRIGAESFFPTLGQAVDRYVEATGAAWTDWES
jgi:high affinity sulfate transporter 1